jgi:hypothetical protein
MAVGVSAGVFGLVVLGAAPRRIMEMTTRLQLALLGARVA